MLVSIHTEFITITKYPQVCHRKKSYSRREPRLVLVWAQVRTNPRGGHKYGVSAYTAARVVSGTSVVVPAVGARSVRSIADGLDYCFAGHLKS